LDRVARFFVNLFLRMKFFDLFYTSKGYFARTILAQVVVLGRLASANTNTTKWLNILKKPRVI
jgi:hypothetical protein